MTDDNTVKWQSDDAVQAWLDGMASRERKRRPQWEPMGRLLPFETSGLERQLGFLRDAGFEAIDVYWKHLDYVIYGGARPGTA